MIPEDADNLEVIDSLVEQWLEGVISTSDKERLNRLLLLSAAGRQRFLQSAHLEASLHWAYSANKQVAALLDGDSRDIARPIAEIVQQNLWFVRDEHFVHVMQACAANEGHSQAWLQIFPRILGLAALDLKPGSSATSVVEMVVEGLLKSYSPAMNTSEFWAMAGKATRDALSNDSDEARQWRRSIDDVAVRAFSLSEEDLVLDAIAIHEVLDECIPHHLPPDLLRLLFLRYLHGLTPTQIASHLGMPVKQVKSHLAKVRVHLVLKCLAAVGVDAREIDSAVLVRWSEFLDGPGREAKAKDELARWTSGRHDWGNHVLLLSIVHDCLGRLLTINRLFDEISGQRNSPLLQVVDQSIRDIEALATTRAKVVAGSTQPPATTRPVYIAALMGIAAGLLIAVGVTVLVKTSPELDTPIAAVPPTTHDVPPAQPEEEPLPKLLPVVAVVSEQVGFPAGTTSSSFAVGSLFRIEDEISFERGVLQVSTTAGSTLVFEGPVRAVLKERNRLELQGGKVTGLNHNAGDVLIVDSPRSRVVDVGTEFGVEVGDSEETIVAVYQGEVRLESPDKVSQAPTSTQNLKAGWETTIRETADIAVMAVPLTHEREFVRPDEVQLRKEAEAGLASAEAKVRFFDLLRVEGLIAYQGFDEQSRGAEFSFGFREPHIRQQGELDFAPNIGKHSRHLWPSASLVARKNSSLYLDVDTSEKSGAAKAGLVDETGMIGRRPGELWLSWRTQAVGAADTKFAWAGMSLMFGDQRSVDEPLFVGQTAIKPYYGFHTFPGKGDPGDIVKLFDVNSAVEGDQPRSPDFDGHLWLLRLRMDGESAEAAAWCDVPPTKVESVPPQVVHVVDDFHFDRIRLEAQSAGEDGTWHFDDVVIASKSSAIAKALELAGQETTNPMVPEKGSK